MHTSHTSGCCDNMKKSKFYIYNEFDEELGYTLAFNLVDAHDNARRRFSDQVCVVTETPINPWPFKDTK